MAVNLLELFRDAIGDQTPVKISSYLGESTENTRSAIGTTLPAVLGGLLEKGQDLQGAAGILDFINHEEIDGTILDKLEEVLGGGKNTTELIEKGGGILDFIWGDKKLLDSVVDIVTNRSGIGRGSSDTLIKIVTPLLMGVIGHQVKSKTLDSQGINQLLLSQKSVLEAAAPTGMLDNLGYSVFTKPAETKIVKKTDSEEGEEEKAEETKQSAMSRIIPWIILISVALGLLYIMKSCGGRPQSANLVDMPGEELENSIDSAAEKIKRLNALDSKPLSGAKTNLEATRTTTDGVSYLNLPGGQEIEVSENSFVDELFRFLNEGGSDPYTRFTFDELSFYDSTSNITLASANQLQQVAGILKAFPSTNIQIEAHTDLVSSVEANKRLSEQRSLSVKEALVAAGIDSERVLSVGLGEQKPMKKIENGQSAPPANRIDIFITQK